jgi:hypothetical protein
MNPLALMIQPPDIAGSFSRGQDLQTNKLRQLALQKQMQVQDAELGERTETRNLLKEIGPDLARGNEAALGRLATVNPKAALEYRGEARKAETAGIEAAMKRAEIIGRAAGTVLDAPPEMRPLLYKSQLNQLRALGLPVDGAPEQYDEGYLRGALGQATSIADRLKAQAEKGFSLSPGQTRFDASGNPVASVPERPQRDTAMDAKIAEMMSSLGVDRRTAAGIATGAVKVVTDPVNNRPFLVDLASGSTRALAMPQTAQAEPQPTAQAPATPTAQSQMPTAYDAVSGSTGVVPAVRRAVSATIGQAAPSLSAPDIAEKDTVLGAVRQGLIEALSISGRPPVVEQERILKMIPSGGALENPVDATAQLGTLKQIVERQIADDTTYSQRTDIPAKAAQEATERVRALRRVLGQIGEPPASQRATNTPTVGTVDGGYRFKGGNPADKNSWEKVQ